MTTCYGRFAQLIRVVRRHHLDYTLGVITRRSGLPRLSVEVWYGEDFVGWAYCAAGGLGVQLSHTLSDMNGRGVVPLELAMFFDEIGRGA